MKLHQEMLTTSKAARPRILKMARQSRLVNECFKEFQRLVFPGASQDQVAVIRASFFAGAAELHAMLIYASDTAADDVELLNGIFAEIERFHGRTIQTAGAPAQSQPS